MAFFRLRNDAETWFSEIKGQHIRSKFDLYYFCLMAGFASGRHSDAHLSGVEGFIDYFIDDYKPASNLIIGLLVVTEMKYKGIDVTDKGRVRALFKEIVDANNGNNHLTDYGMKRMNAYASGGYEYLSERRSQKPYSVEEFLSDYVKLIGEASRPR